MSRLPASASVLGAVLLLGLTGCGAVTGAAGVVAGVASTTVGVAGTVVETTADVVTAPVRRNKD